MQGAQPRFQIREGKAHLSFGAGILNPLVKSWLSPTGPLAHSSSEKQIAKPDQPQQIKHNRKQKAFHHGCHRCCIIILIYMNELQSLPPLDPAANQALCMLLLDSSPTPSPHLSHPPPHTPLGEVPSALLAQWGFGAGEIRNCSQALQNASTHGSDISTPPPEGFAWWNKE